MEREAITSGAWEDDVVDRVLAHSSDQITVGNVKDAVASYKAATPAAFVTLSATATNPNLPAHERFAFSYREVMKARQRKESLARVLPCDPRNAEGGIMTTLAPEDPRNRPEPATCLQKPRKSALSRYVQRRRTAISLKNSR